MQNNDDKKHRAENESACGGEAWPTPEVQAAVAAVVERETRRLLEATVSHARAVMPEDAAAPERLIAVVKELAPPTPPPLPPARGGGRP